MKPVARRLFKTLHLFGMSLAMLTLLFSLAPPLHAQDQGNNASSDQSNAGLEGTSDTDYIEIDDIMKEDETKAVQNLEAKSKDKQATASEQAAPPEEKEFVNLNDILYGGGEKELAKDATSGKPAPTKKSMQEDMENLKDKVLKVNRDLFVLEEDLLYPSSTQINVFVAYDALPYFQLDGVNLKINNRPVSSHLYTERELKALNRGAVQRLYTGNLPVGEHELVAVITGVGPKGRDYKRAVSIEFKKDSGTKYIELQIEGDNASEQPTFRLKQWE